MKQVKLPSLAIEFAQCPVGGICQLLGLDDMEFHYSPLGSIYSIKGGGITGWRIFWQQPILCGRGTWIDFHSLRAYILVRSLSWPVYCVLNSNAISRQVSCDTEP